MLHLGMDPFVKVLQNADHEPWPSTDERQGCEAPGLTIVPKRAPTVGIGLLYKPSGLTLAYLSSKPSRGTLTLSNLSRGLRLTTVYALLLMRVERCCKCLHEQHLPSQLPEACHTTMARCLLPFGRSHLFGCRHVSGVAVGSMVVRHSQFCLEVPQDTSVML